MYKIVIVDDEPLARQLIKTLLSPYHEMSIVRECSDGFEGFKAIQEDQPDLIFLDVQMPRLTGFEMLEMLEAYPSVIFTTAFDQYALQAFDAHAVDYLLKPITKERFDKAVKKWLQSAGAQTERIKQMLEHTPPTEYERRVVVKDGGKIRIIPVQDILYMEADDDYLRINTPYGTFLKKGTMSRMEHCLDPNVFARVHRSYLIPVAQLFRIEPYEKDSHIAVLQCGARIPVSRNGMTLLKSKLKW